jgi:transcriptional regulator with XRE-family HTH domain
MGMTNTDRIETAAREIGHRIRSARSSAGLKLSDLAERTGLSEGFLSKLERGLASSSIANLIQITEVLGLGLQELFTTTDAPPRKGITAYQSNDGAFDEVESTGYRWRHLAGGGALDQMELFYLVFPRRDRMTAMVSHPGQEHCYVLSGEIRFYVADECHHLCAGEGVFIDSELPHRAENVGDAEAHVLMTIAKSAESKKSLDWWRLPAVRAVEVASRSARRNDQ